MKKGERGYEEERSVLYVYPANYTVPKLRLYENIILWNTAMDILLYYHYGHSTVLPLWTFYEIITLYGHSTGTPPWTFCSYITFYGHSTGTPPWAFCSNITMDI
jgi:hypothetical protein